MGTAKVWLTCRTGWRGGAEVEGTPKMELWERAGWGFGSVTAHRWPLKWALWKNLTQVVQGIMLDLVSKAFLQEAQLFALMLVTGSWLVSLLFLCDGFWFWVERMAELIELIMVLSTLDWDTWSLRRGRTTFSENQLAIGVESGSL